MYTLEEREIVVPLSTHDMVLTFKAFPSNQPIDTEELLQIQWFNPIGDIITFPVFLNNVGLMKADVDDVLREAELDLEIFEAEKRKFYRKALIKEEPKARGEGVKYIYPTETEVKDSVTTDREYKVKREYVNAIKKGCDVLAALYNAAKSKNTKLDSVTMKLQPKEFEVEIAEGMINGVMIRRKEKFARKS